MKYFWLFPVILFSFTATGCDMINPQKSQPKEAAVSSKVPAAAVSAIDESKPLPDDVIATVGAWRLTSAEFNERLKLLKESLPAFDPNKEGTKEAVLNELIRQQLLVKDAEEEGIGQNKDITDAIEDFRRTMLVQELANRLTKDLSVTEAEAQKYYNDNKVDFVMPIQWKVREIVLADETVAKNTLVSLLQGANFAEIAKEQSKGKTAKDGGALKTFNQAPTTAMQSAIANLEAGGTSSVFKGLDNNYYIVRVEEKKGGETKAFSEIKADLIAALTTRKQQQAVLEHINKLAEKNKVRVNQNLIGSAK